MMKINFLLKVVNLIFVCLLCAESQASKILFIYPIATTSETHLFLPLANSLAGKGHEITIVTPVKTEKLQVNIRQIVPTKPLKDAQFFVTSNIIEERKLIQNKLSYMASSNFTILLEGCHHTFQNEEFKKLYKEDFDLILMSGFANDCFEGLVYKFQVPFVRFSSLPVFHYTAGRIGLHFPPSFIPVPIFDFQSRMNFGERFYNTLMVWMISAMTSSMASDYENIYRNYLGEDVPLIEELEKKYLSLVISNSHFSMNSPRPALPDLIEVGGIHCRKPNLLPKDLNDFINSAEHGVIFFSLGSVVSTKTLPDNIRQIFLNVFCKLKQKVLWKWDTEEMANLPANVKLSKWLPQQDILGHPNVKLFISHGGLLSTQESTYHGVPILGIPLFVDQDMNVVAAQQSGYAIMQEILDITEESFGEKINKILNNPSFAAAAKKMSDIFKDQLETPLEKATYWVEYVLRHKGAQHMRSPARELNFLQYHSIDVVAAVAGIFLTIGTAIVLVIRLLCCRGKAKKSLKQDKSSQNKKSN